MNRGQKIIGVALQCVASVLFAISATGLCISVASLLNLTASSIIGPDLDLASYLLPFPLWFLGCEVRRGSVTAIRMTMAAMIYLCVFGVVVFAFLLFSGLSEQLLGRWKAWAYAVSVALIVIPLVCAYGLRRGNVAYTSLEPTPTAP